MWNWDESVPIAEDEAPQRTAEDADSTPQAMVSIVLWLRGPREVTLEELALAATRAWGIDRTSEEGSATSFVVGAPPTLIVQVDAGERFTFFVNVFATPYADIDEMVQGCKDLRLRRCICDHRAWLSVDLLGDRPAEDRVREAYQWIGKLVAELVDDDALVVYVPELEQANPLCEEMIQQLKSDDPLATVREPAFVPVIEIAEDDPDLLASIAEARARWLEFVAAFESRGDGDHFSVKAPITAGDRTEVIWLSVTAIENDVVYGKLGNDPVDLGGRKEGDVERFRVADIQDWMYIVDGEPTGLFSAPVIAKRMKQYGQSDLR